MYLFTVYTGSVSGHTAYGISLPLPHYLPVTLYCPNQDEENNYYKRKPLGERF